MSALPLLVNAQPGLPLSDKGKSSSSALKDSVKENRAGVAKLIETIMKSGTDANIGSNLAPVIGLPKAMPTKKQRIEISRRANDSEARACFVVYENAESATAEAAEKRPVCAYIMKINDSGTDRKTHYFRVDLNGKLEKVILSRGKYDAAGKVVRGSGVKTDLDIDSPEVKKAFEAEMKFWLKDWLKKQQKLDAKKATAAAAKSGSVAKKGSATADSAP